MTQLSGNCAHSPGVTVIVRLKIGPLRRLWPYLWRYRGRLALASGALIIAAGATLCLPVALRLMIDAGFSPNQAARIDRYFLLLFGVAGVMAIATALRYYWVTWLGERLVADLRQAVYAHVIRLDPPFFETLRTGEVLSRLSADTTLIQTAIGSSVSIVLRNALLFSGGLLMLLVTSPALTTIILVLIPLVLVPVLYFGRRVRRLSRSSQDRVADTGALAQEVLSAIGTVQSFAQEPREARRYGVLVEAAFQAARQRMFSRALLTAFAILLMFGAIVLVLWFGAQAVIRQDMSGGQLGQFLLYALFTGGAVAALSESWGEIQRAAGATERLLELLDAQVRLQVPSAPRALPVPLRADVVFKQLCFAYPSRPQQPVLTDFDLQIKEGETVALVGASGAGKSTLFSLLLRYYDWQSGDIRLAGVSIRDCDPRAIRQQIAIVPQEPAIFADSALENIRYGRPNASRAQVEAAARRAQAEEFLLQQPDAYDSQLGERGMRLSGGQKQRIAIARALLQDAPLVLLDEATSALDAESEAKVQQALHELTERRTTLIIAHRLATVREVDRIVVLDQGRVVASGTHAQLMAEGGLYARLASLQFRDA